MTSAAVLAATNNSGGAGTLILPLILIVFVAFMFLSQRRRRTSAAQMRQGLGPGAVVITAGGLHATVLSVDGGVVSLEVAPGVVCQFEAASIARVVSRPGDALDGSAAGAGGISTGTSGGAGALRRVQDEEVSLRKLPPDDQPPPASERLA